MYVEAIMVVLSLLVEWAKSNNMSKEQIQRAVDQAWEEMDLKSTEYLQDILGYTEPVSEGEPYPGEEYEYEDEDEDCDDDYPYDDDGADAAEETALHSVWPEYNFDRECVCGTNQQWGFSGWHCPVHGYVRRREEG